MNHYIKLLFTVAAHIGLSGFSHASVVTAHFTSAATVPVSAASYTATGNTIELSLGYAPATGTNLTVVRNTGLPFINGTFANLAHGQAVNLTFGDKIYKFVANYYGGTGNDLVLHWADNRLMGWGSNLFGSLGNNSEMRSTLPIAVDTNGVLAGKTIVSISVGSSHSLVLCSDGTLASWGVILGNNSFTKSSVPLEVSRVGALAGKTVIAISAGISHNLALCSDGSVAAWGHNGNGRLGNNSSIDSPSPVAVSTVGPLSGKTVVAISAGHSHSLALCSDGTVVAWGDNFRGALGNNSTTSSLVPVAVSLVGPLSGKNVTAISASTDCSYALRSDGVLVAWGSGYPNPTWATSLVPITITSGALAGKVITSFQGGATTNYNHHRIALFSDGTLGAWGAYGGGQLGNNSDTEILTPVNVIKSGALVGKTVTATYAGQGHSLALCSDGSLAAWGGNSSGQLGIGETSTRSLVPVAVSTTTLSASERFVALAHGAGDSRSFALVASQARSQQSITFPAIANQALAENTTVALNATTSSNLPITYRVMSGPAWVNGSTLTLYGVGTVVVQASQAGDAAFIPASSVNQTFTISLGAPPRRIFARVQLRRAVMVAKARRWLNRFMASWKSLKVD
jgi:alpha-tubulin suppressor-like RCC1 family protein